MVKSIFELEKRTDIRKECLRIEKYLAKPQFRNFDGYYHNNTFWSMVNSCFKLWPYRYTATNASDFFDLLELHTKVEEMNNTEYFYYLQFIYDFVMWVASHYYDADIYGINFNKKIFDLFINNQDEFDLITTNYDNFIERYILDEHYTVFTRQHEMFSKDSYNVSELYKIHGSIDDASTIVITKDDYAQFNESRKLFIAKMLTLFTESPIIFLGYSFTDENIRQIVVDFLNCLTPEQLDTISDNFIFITYKENEKDLIEIKRTIITEKGENIPITEIATDNFLKVYKTINQLIPGMTPKNIRDTQRLVKRIVNNTIVSGDPSNVIFGIDEIPDDLSDKNIAIAIGNKEDIINQYGYSVVKDEEILEDIIFNNKKFNSKNMCKERFKSLPLNRLMPVYKYIKRAKIDINEVPKLKNYVNYHDEIDKIITPTYKKKNLKNAPKFNNITEVKKYMQETNDINKVFKGVLNSIDYLSLYQLREICKLYFYNYIDKLIKNSNFKRVVMYIDYKENYK